MVNKLNKRNNAKLCSSGHCDIFSADAESVYDVKNLNIIFDNKITLHIARCGSPTFETSPRFYFFLNYMASNV